MRYRAVPDGETAEEVWVRTRLARQSAAQTLPLKQKNGERFWFCEPPRIRRALSEIDSKASGAIGVPGTSVTRDTQSPFLQKSVTEEPFMSSVLEGAATTRTEAKEMIEMGRPPRSLDDRMVLNNHRAMEFIRERRSEPLTPGLVLELHRIITEDTLDNPLKAGLLRGPDDRVVVEDGSTGDTLHAPPGAAELPKRLEELCAFANGETDGHVYVHPIMRAIILHFMLGYDHPFVDGNGRTARALFYWSVLRAGYWLLEYVSISSVIKRAPVKYGRAYLLTETDDGDLTYFIDHQLGVICDSIESLHSYIAQKDAEFRDFDGRLAAASNGLNVRQRALLQHAIRKPGAVFTISGHQARHQIAYLTARADLEGLAQRRLLLKTKKGVTSLYAAPKTLSQTLGPF